MLTRVLQPGKAAAQALKRLMPIRTKRHASCRKGVRRTRNVVGGGRVVAGEATRPRRMKRLRRRQAAMRRARIVMSTEATDAYTGEANEATSGGHAPCEDRNVDGGN